jgi:integrase/recombinase XerC
MQEFLVSAKADLQTARQNWLKMLANERRLSPETVEAYERDTRQFLQFLTGHCGGPPGLGDIAELRSADLRAFLAARRNGGAGARTLGRGLAGVRSFLRFLERRGLANAAGAAALRAPKQPKSLPKPLTAGDARRVVSAGEQLAEEPWIAARNAAVLTLLYGCGLRISEALGLKGMELSSSRDGVLRITGKGGRQGWCRCCRSPCRRSPNIAASVRTTSIRKGCSFAARAAGRSIRRSSSARWRNCARRSTFRTRRRRTRCATPSPPICSAAAAI